MGRGRFASTGVTVGTTPQTGYEKRLQHAKGSVVTMGNGLPRQIEGAVGDITVREISGVGLRAYIKTDSGWYDINTLIPQQRLNWIDMTLVNSWATNATHGKPQYCKDSNGFIHFRGGANSGSSFSATITTLPEGFRPTNTLYILTTRTGLATTLQVVKITNLGVVSISSQAILDVSTAIKWDEADTDEVATDTTVGAYLEGVSFFASQPVFSPVTSGGGARGERSDIGQGSVL